VALTRWLPAPACWPSIRTQLEAKKSYFGNVSVVAKTPDDPKRVLISLVTQACFLVVGERQSHFAYSAEVGPLWRVTRAAA
jgi:hypothetical protein